MCSHFKSYKPVENSCDVQRKFGIIKSNIFSKYKLPVSAPFFVETMVKRVNSMATLAKLSMNSMINQNDDLESLEELDECEAIEDLKTADGHVKIYDVS